ncbi:F-type H+-transporting ATPase subunit a [Peptoniphilus ivorii]|uniref:F0F1 ATP synthase subunit A n=1 Tax=Aedoeadaptatus ivorii TaxID=54006 RepID=UPI00278B5185|nr:F0F1 ATP synthase subunit A [Peptoniphilus ivorii]MDQ0508557.1 F-type H+-transporting ATPase subunit a [Peptoniphilus ivorii]
MKRGILFHANGQEIWLHESLFTTFVIVIFLTVLSIWLGAKIKKADYRKKPEGILHITEILVEGVRNLTAQVMGEHNLGFAPYMLSLGAFLVCANLSGLLGFVPPTSDYNVTLALALITFVMIHFFSVKTKGLGGYFKQFAEPLAILTPINILGELANPVSLSFRLFGNILSGMLIMSLVYQGLSKISHLLIPLVAWPLHGYFDVFSGLLQTFIFLMLSMTYISSNMADPEEMAERRAAKHSAEVK